MTLRTWIQKGMLKLGLNKEKKRISLLQLLTLADIIVFSDAFSLLSVGCQFERKEEGKVWSPPHLHHPPPA